MASFSFTKLDASEPTNLADVDKAMCKDVKEKCYAKRYSAFFNMVTEIGFAILMGGGSHVTEIRYKRWRAKCTDLGDYFDKNETAVKKYLYGEYKFTAWR